MKDIRLSVIIPVYKVEQYLRRCVDSVLNQTFKELEVILVDDGSPDGSPAICDEYAQRDSRVYVIHKKNGGLSSARNAGLDMSLKGDYVTFVDSDDWIEPDMYEYMMSLVVKYKADVVEVDMKCAFSEEEKLVQSKEIINIFDEKDIIDEYMETTTRQGGFSCCDVLFNRSNISDIRFREGKKCEDMDFKYKVLARSKRYVKSNQMKYYYFQHGTSISTGGLTRKDFEVFEAAEVLKELTDKEDYGNIRQNGLFRYARAPFSIIAKMAFYGLADESLTKKEVLAQWMPMHKKNLWTLLQSPMPLSRKVLSVAFALNYPATEGLLHLAKKLNLIKS